jgi:hypothetical protein
MFVMRWQNAQLVKDMHVEGLSFYWRVSDAGGERGPDASAIDMWLDSVGTPHHHHQDAVLPGLDCDLRLMMLTGAEKLNTCNV